MGLIGNVMGVRIYNTALDDPAALGKDAPIGRPIQTADQGRITEVPHVGGLHHRHERIAA
ncbi:MAG: hypothetical protein WCC21_15080 [Candidatus Acidiferrales bacterium]